MEDYKREKRQSPYSVNILLKDIDPLPQALILTAIVISFGVTAFS
jgi:multisubunit Na+/H+ antiporter MnhC subunit